MIAGLLDDLPGFGPMLPRLGKGIAALCRQIPPRVRQMAIRLKPAHPAARGDRERFIQIPPRFIQFARDPPQLCARQQAERHVILLSRLPQAVHRAVEVGRADL